MGEVVSASCRGDPQDGAQPPELHPLPGSPSPAWPGASPPLRSAPPNCFSLSACMNVNKTGIDCSAR